MKKCCKWHNNLDNEAIDCGMAGMGDRDDSFCCKKCPERLVPVHKILNEKDAVDKPLFLGIQDKLIH